MNSRKEVMCPKCQKPIDYLINYCNNITEEYIFTLRDGEPYYEQTDRFSGLDSETIYVCPECLEELFTDEEDAIKFLKGCGDD